MTREDRIKIAAMNMMDGYDEMDSAEYQDEYTEGKSKYKRNMRRLVRLTGFTESEILKSYTDHWNVTYSLDFLRVLGVDV